MKYIKAISIILCFFSVSLYASGKPVKKNAKDADEKKLVIRVDAPQRSFTFQNAGNDSDDETDKVPTQVASKKENRVEAFQMLQAFLSKVDKLTPTSRACISDAAQKSLNQKLPYPKKKKKSQRKPSDEKMSSSDKKSSETDSPSSSDNEPDQKPVQ